MSKDNRNSKENKKEKQNKRLWTILISLIILLVALIGLSIYLMQNKEKEDENTLAYTAVSYTHLTLPTIRLV